LEKDYLYRRKRAGASHAVVAQELGCAAETVRKHWQAYRRRQPSGKRGRPASGILSTYPPELVEKAVAYKKEHPHWGPLNVLLELQRYFGERYKRYPSPSRLAALFKARCPEAVQPRRQPKEADEPPALAQQVHQCWQIDAKEAIHLADGELASVLDLRDPASGVMLASQAFLTTLTPKTHRKLSLGEIQATLRQAFSEWGRPAQIQTDHEDVYAGANQSDFPMPFTLWLVGLGIQHVFSRAGRPTDQPHIERNHRTLGDLSWKDQPPQDLADLQRQLDAARQRYNWCYPTQAADCQGQPPLLRHPEALASPRPYQQASEGELFALPAVDDFLAQFRWVRKVDSQGVAYLGNRPYYLGKAYKAQFVRVCFSPQGRTFMFETESGEAIKSLPVKGLDESDLTGLIPVSLPLGVPLQLTLPLVGV
jgi:transposase InsO family protein